MIYNRSTTGVSTSNPVELNHFSFAQVSVQADVTGSATYNIESTLQDVQTLGVAGVNWYIHPSFNGATTSIQGSYAYTPRWVRINQTAGTGTVALTVLQSGLARN